jgi:hypothetical protein
VPVTEGLVGGGQKGTTRGNRLQASIIAYRVPSLSFEGQLKDLSFMITPQSFVIKCIALRVNDLMTRPQKAYRQLVIPLL